MRTQSKPASHMNIEGVVAFVEVVRARSFTAAARTLETTTSAVSKRVARLEAQLGAQLLSRTTRRVTPTDAGRTFHERCSRILAELQAAEVEACESGDQVRGLLRLSLPVMLGERHVAPLIGLFRERYPGLSLELSLNDRYVNLVEEGIDLAVRIGGVLGDSTLVRRRLAKDSLVVVASPDYLARRGAPRSLDDLGKHDCIRFGVLTAEREWRFSLPSGERAVSVASNLVVNHGGAVRTLALAGCGLAILPRYMVSDDLDDGMLRTVLEQIPARSLGIYAVHPAGRQPIAAVRAFSDFLAEHLPARLAKRTAR